MKESDNLKKEHQEDSEQLPPEKYEKMFELATARVVKWAVMKANIHPQYFDDCKVTCACGNTFITGATVPEIRMEICNRCHPFFTGEMKYVDTLGKVEKFQQAQKKAQEIKVKKQEVTKLKAERKRPESLREMFALAKKQASS